MPQNLASALGANLYMARFAGHGLPAENLADVEVSDWLKDGVEALEIGKRLGKKVLLLSVSNGANIATWLASKRQKEIFALLFISPNFRPADPLCEVLLWPWSKYIVPMVKGKIWKTDVLNRRHSKYLVAALSNRCTLTDDGFGRLGPKTRFVGNKNTAIDVV